MLSPGKEGVEEEEKEMEGNGRKQDTLPSRNIRDREARGGTEAGDTGSQW